MKQIINFLLFILNVEIIFTQNFFGPTIIATNADNEESTHYSREKDMGPCTCDLTSHCDYRCCCDEDCPDNIKKDWNENDICVDIHNNRINDFMCKSKKENFNYNKNKSTMTIKDHIFNIMCIQYDNSGDMEEYYLREEESDDTQIDDWINSFFPQGNSRIRNLEDNVSYKYGDNMKNFPSTIYEIVDNCKNNMYYLKTFELTCKIKNNPNFENNNIKKYGDTNQGIKEITDFISYDNAQITMELVHILYGQQNSNNSGSIKVKIVWNNINYKKRAFPYGYQKGTPIKIANKESNSYNYYQNGFFIGVSDKKGFCIENDFDNANIYPILFKNNVIYSCKVEEDKKYNETNIYKVFKDKNLRIGKAPNSSLSNIDEINEWIQLEMTIEEDKDSNQKDMKINLIIFTSKEGKVNNPYEVIKNAKLILKEPKQDCKKISFSVKFVDISYSTIINSKNGKITSFTSPIFKDL